MTTSLLEFLLTENIPFLKIWYYIDEIDGKKMPIGEKNNITMEEMKLNNQKGHYKPSYKKSIKNKTTGEWIKVPFNSEKEKQSLQQAFSIFLKHTEKLFCIDIDDSNIKNMSDFISQTGCDTFKDCCWVAGNTKGIHIYTKINNMIEYTNQVDVYQHFKGDLIHAQNNMWEKTNKEINNYNGSITELDYEDIKHLFNDRLNPRKQSKSTKVDTNHLQIEKFFNKKNVCDEPNVQSAQSVTRKRNICEIIPNNNNTVVDNEGLTKIEELLYMIRIDPKNRNMWLWICSCIKYNNMTNANWERFGELNNLNWDTEKENLFDSCKTDSQKNNINCLQRIAEQNNPEQYKLWLKKWNVYHISAHEVSDPFAASKVIYKSLQHTLRLSKESWFMLQKNNLWKSQKEAGFFIVEEMHQYLDHGRNCLNDLINNSDGEEKEKYTNELKKWMGFYQLVSSNSYISGITKYLRTLLVDDEFPERLNSLTGKLAFRNGIMDLETKTFREGIQWDDYVTETIPHDYHPVESTDFVKEKLKLIVNNNDEHLEYHLSVFGFSFIGMPDLMKSVFFHIDKTDGGKGDNGKSFFFSILNELMPNYVYKSKASFLDKHNKTIHKQLSHIKGKRLIFLEEMPKTQAMNHSLFKEIGDGTTIENEVMYGTCERIKVQCVLHALSNHIPDLSAEEEACYNRYRQISYNSHFDRTGTRTESNFEKLEFVADETLKDRIIKEHADELFNLLIEYAHKFFLRGKKLPPIPTQFSKDTKETKDKNDKFGVWFSENMEVGVGYKVPIKKLEWESKFTAKEIKEGMKRKGYVYNSDLCGMDKDFSGKYYKGGFEGVRIMVDFKNY